MPQLPVVQFESPAAQDLADNRSIVDDLDFVIAASDRLAGLLDAESSDTVLIRALWASAIMAYARCFKSGVRTRATGALEEVGTEGASDVHQLYIDLRDKHVAHPVNAFEDVGVGIVLSNDGPRRRVEGVATLLRKLISHEAGGVRQLGRLAREVRERVVAQSGPLETAVETEANARPIDELYDLPPLGLGTPGPDAAGQARRRAT